MKRPGREGLMYFGFALDASDIDSWDMDLLDTDLDLLDTDIPSKHFVCLQDVLKASSRHVFKTSSRHVFKKSSRRLQCNDFSSSKTSSSHLQDVLEDEKLLSWRRVEDVFRTNKCMYGCHHCNPVKIENRLLDPQYTNT